MTDRTQLLDERQTGIGGSDVAALFSLPPYSCARMLAYEKLSIPPDYPQQETGPMRRGQVLEQIAAEEYERETGNRVQVEPVQRHPVHQWAIVHIDRSLAGANTIVEIKAPGREMYAQIKRDGLSEQYLLQGQHGMLVTGATRCVFIVFNADAWKLLHFDIEPDPEIHEAILTAGDEFWKIIVELRKQIGFAGDYDETLLPKRLDPKSPQCQKCAWRTSCQGDALVQLIGDKTKVAEDPSLEALVNEYVELKAILGEAEALTEECKGRLQVAIGDRPGVQVPGFVCYYRPQTSMRMNEGKVVAYTGGLLEQKARLSVKVDYDMQFAWPATVRLPVSELKVESVSRPLRIFAK